MAILKVGLIEQNREYFTGLDNLRGVRRIYRVVTDDPIYDEVTVLGAVDPNDAEAIPALGSEFTGGISGLDASLTVSKLTARQTADIYTWEVEVEYTNDLNEDQNVLLRDAEVEWDSFTEKKASTRDLNGNEYRTSSGSPYDPPIEEDVTVHTLTVTKNQDISYDVAANKLLFEDALNQNGWFVPPGGIATAYAAETARCVKIKARTAKEGEFEYLVVTYEFHIKASGWELRIADMDTMKLDANGKQQNITDKMFGGFVTKPVFLDGVGGLLEDAVSTLNGNINGVVTAVVVAGGGGALLTKPLTAVPSLQCFIKIDSEVMEVTSVATDTLTVVRAQRGTAAAAHTTATAVKLEPVFKPFTRFSVVDFDNLGLP
jgi:hypothetical protein